MCAPRRVWRERARARERDTQRDRETERQRDRETERPLFAATRSWKPYGKATSVETFNVRKQYLSSHTLKDAVDRNTSRDTYCFQLTRRESHSGGDREHARRWTVRLQPSALQSEVAQFLINSGNDERVFSRRFDQPVKSCTTNSWRGKIHEQSPRVSRTSGRLLFITVGPFTKLFVFPGFSRFSISGNRTPNSRVAGARPNHEARLGSGAFVVPGLLSYPSEPSGARFS